MNSETQSHIVPLQSALWSMQVSSVDKQRSETSLPSKNEQIRQLKQNIYYGDIQKTFVTHDSVSVMVTLKTCKLLDILSCLCKFHVIKQMK